MRFGLTTALVIGLLWPGDILAHHERDDLRRSVLIELKSVSSQITFARKRLERLISTAGRVSEERIGAAQNAFLQSRPERALVILQDLLSRPDFALHTARPEALFWYAEALLKLKFDRAASVAFAESVSSSRQTKSDFEHRYERMLDVDRGHVAPLVIVKAWNRYQGMRTPTHAAFSRIRYKSGRGLYRSRDYDGAESIFRSIVPADDEYVRASYFLGVIHLRRGEVIDAEKRFQGALAAWRTEKLSGSARTGDVSVHGPPRELEVQTIDDEQESARERRRLGYAIHLALGRLAAHQGEFDRALTHYRRVPPGAPDHAAAQRETIYLLRMSNEHAWAARTLGASLPSRLGDSPQFRRALEYSRLLAEGERYADAEAMFGRIADQIAQSESDMMKIVGKSKGQLRAVRWLFPQLGDRWEAVLQSPKQLAEEVALIQTLYDELNRVAESAQDLPVVAQGLRLDAGVRSRLVQLRVELEELGKLPGVAAGEIKRMAQSVTRLVRRLERFKGRLEQYRLAYTKRLRRVLNAEAPAMVSLKTQLSAHVSEVESHRRGVREALSERLASHDTAAVLGQVNIAFWQKEAVSQKIERLLFEKRKASEPAETFPVEASDPIGPAEISWDGRRVKPTSMRDTEGAR